MLKWSQRQTLGLGLKSVCINYAFYKLGSDRWEQGNPCQGRALFTPLSHMQPNGTSLMHTTHITNKTRVSFKLNPPKRQPSNCPSEWIPIYLVTWLVCRREASLHNNNTEIQPDKMAPTFSWQRAPYTTRQPRTTTWKRRDSSSRK